MITENTSFFSEDSISSSSTPLIITCHQDIMVYCEKHGISLVEFNQPVIIPDGVVSCRGMFDGCSSFNQPVAIPDGVYNCDNMFKDCLSLNQIITMPEGLKGDKLFDGCPLMSPDGKPKLH